MLIYKADNGKFPYPPIGNPIETKHPTKPFSWYQIPQIKLDIQLNPDGSRMPREESNILGQVRYAMQLNNGRKSNG